MKKCSICGKRGFFLKLNQYGRCEECQKKIELEEADAKREQDLLERKRLDSIAAHNSKQLKHVSSEPQSIEPCFFETVDNNILTYKYSRVSIAFPERVNVGLGSFVDFEKEPNNEFDDKAVKVMSIGKKIGYIYRGKLQDMLNDFLKKDWHVEGIVDSVSPDTFTIAIAFYKPFSSFKSITSTLVKTSKKDIFDNSRQDNLTSISCGDLLSMEYDVDSGSYIVSDDFGNELGELSANVSSKLLEQENEFGFKVICENNELDDNLKYKCKVKIFFFNK